MELPTLATMDSTKKNGIAVAICDESFDTIFHTHYRILYAYAFNIVRHQELARDIVQEVFLKLWQRRHRIEITTSLKAYLIRMTRNQCLDTLRSGKHIKMPDVDIDDILLRMEIMELNADDSVLDRMLSDELQSRFQAAVDKLPAQCRRIFLMNRQESMSYMEIAQTLGVAHSTVKNQMMIAMRKLHEALKLFF